jgi:hypothetical protein
LFQAERRNQFPCDFCDKVCKSKGGLTRHRRSKHTAEQGQSSRAVPEPLQIVSSKKVKELISDIGKHLTDEKLYKKEDIAEVLRLQPTDSFVKFFNGIYRNSKIERIITSSCNNFMAKQMLTGKNTSTCVRPRRLYS